MKTAVKARRRAPAAAFLVCLVCFAALAGLAWLGVGLLQPQRVPALTIAQPTAVELDGGWSAYFTGAQGADAQKEYIAQTLDGVQALGADTVLLTGRVEGAALFCDATGTLPLAPGIAAGGLFSKFDPFAWLVKEAAARGMGVGLLATDDAGGPLAPGEALPAWAQKLADTYALAVYTAALPDPAAGGEAAAPQLTVYTGAAGEGVLLRQDESPAVLAAALQYRPGAGKVLGAWPALQEDPSGAAVALAFSAGEAPQVLDKAIGRTLAFAYPDEGAVVYTAQAFLMGTSDPDQPLTINGQEVARHGEQGVWGLLVDLEKGQNTFIAAQGDASVTLNVTRKAGSWSSAKPTSDGSKAAKKGQMVRITETLASALSDYSKNGSIQTTAYKGGMAAVTDSVRFVRSGKYTYAYRLASGDYILAKDCELVSGAPDAAFTGLQAAATEDGDVVLRFEGEGTPIWYAAEEGGALTLDFLSAGFTGETPAPVGFVTGITAAKTGVGFSLTLQFDAAEPLWGYTVDYVDGSTQVYLKRQPRSAGGAQPLAGVTVMLDAGHGGTDDGAMGSAGRAAPLEKDVNLALAKAAQYRLEQLGATVLMTRSDDTFYTLGERVEMMNAAKPDFFIAVHHNSATLDQDLNANGGTECYYFFGRGQALGENLAANMAAVTGRRLRGVFQDYFYVTRSNICPAVLLETGFVTVPAEYESCADPQTIWAEGGAIAQAVLQSLPG